MKILMIVPGGVHESKKDCVIPVLLTLLERLSKNHEITVIALRQHPHYCVYKLFNATVINLGFKRFIPSSISYFLYKQKLKKALRERPGPYDLIHTFWLDMPSFLGVDMARKMKIPLVTSLGGGEMVRLPAIGYGGARSGFNRRKMQRVLETADAVTAGSRYALESITTHRPDARWLPLFPETDPFIDLKRASSTPPWRLLHIGSINRVKDPETLIKAFRVVQEKSPGATLDWVGEDTLGGWAQKLSAEMGVETKIRFHGFLPYDALPELFNKVHLYVQSSLHESQGAAVCEAAAAGVPTVGTEVGLVRELAPFQAVSVPRGDHRALARAIVLLLSNDQIRIDMGARARNWARQYNADWTCDRFESLYESMVSHGRQRE